LHYDTGELEKTHADLIDKLTGEQKEVYNEIMSSVVRGFGGLFFVYGYGGIGKTFLWKTLSAGLRSQKFIVLNVASSGIASLLLPRGRTAHSTFSIPLVIHEASSCNIDKQSPRAKLLLHTKLIIWDEALDRTLRDIMSSQDENNKDKPFGGKVVVLGGDFRQILPVIRKANMEDIVSSTVNSSKVWDTCKVLRLTKNMRLQCNSGDSTQEDIKIFGEWLLKIGDGDRVSNEYGQSDIDIPSDMLIQDSETPLQTLINFAYPEILKNMETQDYFNERAILAPTLDVVPEVNELIISLIPGDEVECLSSDSVCHSDEDSEAEGG